VVGLLPHQAYELKLSVRYGRLGLRKWSEGLAVVAATKKPDAEMQRRALENVRFATGANTEDLSVSRRMVPVPLDASKLETRLYMKEAPRIGARAESPRVLESPRRLPPLDGSLVAAVTLDPSLPHPDVEDWMDVAQADALRITGGFGTSGPVANGDDAVQGTEENDDTGYPARPEDFVPFWRRDPMDGRPKMPHMPSSGHSAMQLDLIGREGALGQPSGASAMVPRPPNSDRTSSRVHRPPDMDRVAYPRRYIHE